jgi:hypothetical protein
VSAKNLDRPLICKIFNPTYDLVIMRYVITFIFITLTFSSRLRLLDDTSSGQNTSQFPFTDQDMLTFQSNNYYLFADVEHCMHNMTGNSNTTNASFNSHGECGRIIGIPLQGNQSLQQNIPLQFQVQKGRQDFYCIKSTNYSDGFLYFEGQHCTNLTQDTQCGDIVFKKNNTCSEEFGWHILNINNFWVFQSAAFPNSYLYFNSQNCQGGHGGQIGGQFGNQTGALAGGQTGAVAGNNNTRLLIDEQNGNQTGALGNQTGALGNQTGALGNQTGALGNQTGALGNLTWNADTQTWEIRNQTGATGNQTEGLVNNTRLLIDEQQGNQTWNAGNQTWNAGNQTGAIGNYTGAAGNQTEGQNNTRLLIDEQIGGQAGGLNNTMNNSMSNSTNANSNASNANSNLYHSNDGCGKLIPYFIKDLNSIQQGNQQYQSLFFTINKLEMQQLNNTLGGQ